MSETLKGMVEALRTHRLFAVYTALVALIVLLAIFAPYLAPQDPMEGDMKNVLQTPSAAHWLGTDKLGRDTFSRIVAGTQVSLFMTLCLVLLVAVVGSVVGIVSGYFGGKVERVLMRFADMMLAFPGVVLAIAIAGILGGSEMISMKQTVTAARKNVPVLPSMSFSATGFFAEYERPRSPCAAPPSQRPYWTRNG